jgi:signal transduction histidine kinase
MNKQNFDVFDELLDGIQVMNGNLSYAYLNEAARQQLGLESVVDGSNFRALCESRGWDELLHLAETCLKERSASRKTLVVHLPNSIQHCLGFTLQLVSCGLIITSAIMEENVTRLKKTERKLRQLNERLEYIVEERTGALREALDREMAENALKSTFLSMASHGFNTPLASIQLSLDVLKKYNTGEHQTERERYHEHIHNEAQNLLGMLTRIKRENPIINRDRDLDKEQVDVKALTAEIAHEIGLLARVKQNILVMHEGENTAFY